jgi:hypothetical protein
MATYSITIHTGDHDDTHGAEPASDVHLTLFGSKASSAELKLGETDDPDAGPSTTHRVALADLGDIQRVRVRHDDTGVGPGCYVDRIVVQAGGTHQEWTFVCRRWLTRRFDDGATERTLDAGDT